MKKEEVMAIISSMEMQLAALKELVAVEEEVVVNENPVEETPVINEQNEEREELPAPPAEIYIDVVEEKPKVTPRAKKKQKEAPDEETIVASQILTKLPDFYRGTCRSITLQKMWHDNTNQIDPKTGKNYTKLHLNKYKVIITAEDIEGKPLGSIVVHWDVLYEWHDFLKARHINDHDTTDDPHTNWMPKVVSLCID